MILSQDEILQLVIPVAIAVLSILVLQSQQDKKVSRHTSAISYEKGGILMKHGTFMAIAAVFALVFGLAFLLIPVQLTLLYGIMLEPDGQWIARCLGSAFLGAAVTTWFGKSAPQGNALRAILLGDFALSVTGFVLAVLYSIQGSANALIWSVAVIYAFLTAGFGYFRFVKPAGA